MVVGLINELSEFVVKTSFDDMTNQVVQAAKEEGYTIKYERG